ncbi:MAG: T9SS type A sorting domain-containing protein [bacterium]
MRLLIVAVIFVTLISPVLAQVTPTNEWVNFWSGNSKINTTPIPVSSVVQAFDPQGVLCGEFTVMMAGKYGLMAVYRDDATTAIDEGAQPGDTISFTINNKLANPKGPASPIWSENGDNKNLNLTVEEPAIEVLPLLLDFGNVKLNSSASLSLWIKDVGLKNLNIDSLKVIYNFPTHFNTSVQSATIAPGESLLVNVDFVPLLGSGSVTADLNIYSNAPDDPVFMVPISALIDSDVTPTNEWVSFWSDSTFINDLPVDTGDVIDVFDPQGVHCGTFTVSSPGSYGLMPVYGDDAFTSSMDEGASPGDSLSFTINGYKASIVGPNQPIWTSNGDVIKLHINAVITSVSNSSQELPANFKLYQNFPNPFNPSTKISFDLPKRVKITLTIYDMLGKEVAELVNEEMPAGSYEVEWQPILISSGVYFYRLKIGKFVSTRKLILMR